MKRLRDFWWTPFLGVLVGRVEDHEAFCGQLCRSEEERPGFLRPLARLIPIDRTFTFQVEHLPAQLERAVLAYAGQIDSGSFYVRIERRGHAGGIHSQSLEQELDRILMSRLREQGALPCIDFKGSGCDCGGGTDRGRMWSRIDHPNDAGTFPFRDGAISKKGGTHDGTQASG